MIPLLLVLFVLLLVLKLAGVLMCSWWIISIPAFLAAAWIPLAIGGAILFGIISAFVEEVCK